MQSIVCSAFTMFLSLKIPKRLLGPIYSFSCAQVWCQGDRSPSQKLRFAGQYHRANGEIISCFLLWHPSGGVISRNLTFSDLMTRDSGWDIGDLGTAMQDRAVLKGTVNRGSDQPQGCREMIRMMKIRCKFHYYYYYY